MQVRSFKVADNTQTRAVIEVIRKHPGIKRSDLIDIRVNGNRIANLTARISEARKILAPYEKIICIESSAERRVGRNRHTAYKIVECEKENQ